jgi:DNA-binding beta-propeller fold protein YncE
VRAIAIRAPGRRASRILGDLAVTALLAALCLGCPSRAGEEDHWSDQNRDGVVDLADVILFSDNHLGKDWRTVDWCQWLRSGDPHLRKRRMRRLFTFMADYFECDTRTVASTNRYPTRLTWASDGRLYVSDALAGSVFVYERQPELTAVAEYPNLAKPLGVALSPAGNLYVGVDGRHRVEVYDAAGFWITTIGRSTIRMPNDLAFDADGNLYVADSRSNRVWVFDRRGDLVRGIGEGELRFPVALDVSGAELYVADQGNYQIKVFDLEGNLLRALGGPVTQGSLGYKWRGKFVRLEAVAVDAAGRLHALDSHQGLIEVLDAASGAFLTSYGEKGTGPGQLSLPMDIAVNSAGEAAVGDADNQRIEILAIP